MRHQRVDDFMRALKNGEEMLRWRVGDRLPKDSTCAKVWEYGQGEKWVFWCGCNLDVILGKAAVKEG